MGRQSGLVRLLTVLTRASLGIWIADIFLVYRWYFDAAEYLKQGPQHPWAINLKGRLLFVDDAGWWMAQIADWGLIGLLGLSLAYTWAVERTGKPTASVLA